MSTEKQLTEQESLRLITDMLRQAKGSYHETGIGSLLWGTVVSIASFVTYLRIEYKIEVGFDIWLLVLFAIVPQIIISWRESKQAKAKQYADDMVNAVWLVYGLTIFGFSLYQQIVPDVTKTLILEEGWVMMKHLTDGSQPDVAITPFTPSFYSLYILVYAFPTLVTGMVKKFKPKVIGAVLTYGLFLLSCFTKSSTDMLLGAVAALLCWFIPGVILRIKYRAAKRTNV